MNEKVTVEQEAKIIHKLREENRIDKNKRVESYN